MRAHRHFFFQEKYLCNAQMHRGYKPEFSEFMETLLSSLHSMHVAFSVMGAIKLKILRGDAASENYETILHTFACSSLIIL